MKILILSQVFWPDTVSTAQHLSDLAFKLSENNEVRVLSSRHNYENPKESYAANETVNSVRIIRINNSSLGKKNLIFRCIDFFSFNFLLLFKLFAVNNQNTDIIIGLTSPPLISFIGVLLGKKKNIRFYYWVMDLQPELSISSGLIKANSLIAKLFQAMGNYILKNASKVIVLDKYMRDYVIKRGAKQDKVYTVPVWPVMDTIYKGSRLDNPFRKENSFGNRIVVMFSGNHSFIHPMDTLLDAVFRLRHDSRFVFVFIGGGLRKKDVSIFKAKHQIDSIVQLNYQPRQSIHLSLGSADIQVVILGNNQVGFTHPNKIYGSMFIGKPILYIGPEQSHITDIISLVEGNISIQHGQGDELATALIDFANKKQEEQDSIGILNKELAGYSFHPDILKSQMYELITQN